MAPPGEPQPSPKPQPIGNTPLLILLTTCTLCILFLLWRRANSLKAVISYRLKTWREPEGRIRLSQDDGPPAREFIEDDDDDIQYEEDGEPLDEPVRNLSPNATPALKVDNSKIIQLPVRPQ